MQAYLELLKDIIENGVDGPDRTGVGTRSVFGRQFRHDLSSGFPLLTTKKVHAKGVIHELLWFLSGSTNIRYLQENGVSIWDEWATPEGELGPVYGAQWRKWPDGKGGYIDQIAELVKGLKEKPHSRRHIFHAWNVADLPDEGISPVDNASQGKMALPPCHLLYQFYVSQGKLSGGLYIRSSDAFLGLPYNMASLAFLVHMLAQQCDLAPGEIVITLGDLHLYHNHITPSIVHEQLHREPGDLPSLRFARKPDTIFDYEYNDFIIDNYHPASAIKAPIAV